MSESTEMTKEMFENLDTTDQNYMEMCIEAADEIKGVLDKYPKLFFCCAIGCRAGFNTTIGGYGNPGLAMDMMRGLMDEIFETIVKNGGDNNEKGEC